MASLLCFVFYLSRFEIVHYEEIDEEQGEHHIEERLIQLKNSEARIMVLYSTTDRSRRIFQVLNSWIIYILAKGCQIAEGLGLLSGKYLWIGTQSVKGWTQTALPPMHPGMLSVNFHTVWTWKMENWRIYFSRHQTQCFHPLTMFCPWSLAWLQSSSLWDWPSWLPMKATCPLPRQQVAIPVGLDGV